MDFKELIKYKLLTDSNYQSNNDKSFFTAITYQFIVIFLLSSIDHIIKLFSQLFHKLNTYCSDRIDKKINQIDNVVNNVKYNDNCIPLNKKHDNNVFKCKRIYDFDENDNKSKKEIEQSNMIVDAILSEISKLHNIPEFKLIENGKVLVTYKDKPIQITNEIYFMLNNIVYSNDKISYIDISLLSNVLTATELIGYTMNLYEQYKVTINNSLGSNIYFFDHKSKEGTIPRLPIHKSDNSNDDILQHKRMLISTASKNLTFTKTLFTSNKSFHNICGDDIRLIEKRVHFFMNNKDWYDNKGIPYQLGILLSGVPGSGKTSVIRAIANITKRHIINVNFGNITTATQLKSIFQSDIINVYKDNFMNETIQYHIPIDKRLYVLEEIDAVSDIVKKRGSIENKNIVSDELTLGEILTVLDGTMEIPGRMLIMTSNFPETLDDALIRPGRIDIQVKFGYCSKEIIQEIYKIYFDKEIEFKNIDKIPVDVLTPAEVGQLFFKYITSNNNNETDIINTLIEQSKQFLYRKHNKSVVDVDVDIDLELQNYNEKTNQKTKLCIENNNNILQTNDVKLETNDVKLETNNDEYSLYLKSKQKYLELINDVNLENDNLQKIPEDTFESKQETETSYQKEKQLTLEYEKNKKSFNVNKREFEKKTYNNTDEDKTNWKDIKYMKPTDNFNKFFEISQDSTSYDDMFN